MYIYTVNTYVMYKLINNKYLGIINSFIINNNKTIIKLIKPKQCRTLLVYQRSLTSKNIVHYMCSTPDRCWISSLYCHSDALQEVLVGLRLSSLSPDKPTNVWNEGQNLRTKGTGGLHCKGRKVMGGAEVRVLIEGNCTGLSGSQCNVWWRKGVWVCCIPNQDLTSLPWCYWGSIRSVPISSQVPRGLQVGRHSCWS